MQQHQLLLQNWTGSLAVYAPAPSHACLAQPVKGVSASAKHSGGTWLKAASDARLRIEPPCARAASGRIATAAPTISLYLQETLLLMQPLASSSIQLTLLPCARSSILALTPLQQAATSAAQVVFCFCFYDQPDCNSFVAALQAASAHQAQQLREQQQQHGAGSGNREAQQGAVHAAAGHTHAGGDDAGADASAAAASSSALARQAIQRYLLDPSFHRLVDEVDALWDEVVAQLEVDGLLPSGA